jgi:hypothetical protein
MGRKTTRGLINRKGIWHIDKVVRGRRVCESTGECAIEKAGDRPARKRIMGINERNPGNPRQNQIIARHPSYPSKTGIESLAITKSQPRTPRSSREYQCAAL